MSKNISEIKIEYFLIISLALLILPFLILHYYNNPNAEDFFYGENAERTGFLDAQEVLYKYWGGRYFTYIFLSITPLTFNSIIGYKFFTFSMMLVFLYVLYLLISEITKNGLELREKILITLSICFLYLYAMPTVSEVFYWYASLVGYLFAIILFLIFSIFYLRLKRTENLQKKIFYLILCCLTIIAIAGSIELSAVLIVILMFFLLVKSIFVEKKFDWTLLFMALITVIAVYIAFSAPGNSERSSKYPENYKLFYSMYSSAEFLVKEIFLWISGTPLLPLTLLLIPVLFRAIRGSTNSSMFSINPVYSLLVTFIVLFSNVFLIFWSMGISPYSRIINFIYFLFLIGWFYNAAVITFYINKKFDISIKRLSKYVYAIGFTAVALFLIKGNNISTAYHDLLGGVANKYDNEMKARFDSILQCGSDSCEVDSVKNIPGAFYFFDNAADPNQFVNRGYELYFNKKSISLKKKQ